jgi:hypothetical protein
MTARRDSASTHKEKRMTAQHENQPAATSDREDAMQRLESGLLEQARCSDRYDAALGTSTEMAAYARLRAAGARVAAHETWLRWVDDDDYQGLNTGPYVSR